MSGPRVLCSIVTDYAYVESVALPHDSHVFFSVRPGGPVDAVVAGMGVKLEARIAPEHAPHFQIGRKVRVTIEVLDG